MSCRLADTPVGGELDGLCVVAAPHVDVKRADAEGTERAAVRDAAVRAPLLRVVTFDGTEAELRARLARLTDGFTVEGMLAAPLTSSSDRAANARKQRRRAHEHTSSGSSGSSSGSSSSSASADADADADDVGDEAGAADSGGPQRFVLLVQLHGRVAVAREGLVSQFVRARL